MTDVDVQTDTTRHTVRERTILVNVFAGTLHEWTESKLFNRHLPDDFEAPNLRIICNDAHYYLVPDINKIFSPGCTPLIESNRSMLRNCMWYFSGMSYDIIPGHYSYMLKEGSFQIESRSKSLPQSDILHVSSLPNGAESPYRHPLVSHETTSIIDAGWYGWFAYVGLLSNFRLRHVPSISCVSFSEDFEAHSPI